eukprot:403373955
MKETKLLGKENSSEEEKTRIEQIEEEVKNSIYSVFYLLLKNQETTFWKFILLLIIEYLQLLSFSFDDSLVEEWKADSVVSYFAQFLGTFRIVYWLQKLSWDVYIIIFYIAIFLVFIIIMDFLYVAISFKHKKFSFMQPVQILRIASILIQTILFIPITEFFFSLSACSTTNGVLTHVVYEDEICFQSIHVLHIALSYLMLLVFVAMTILACMMHYENRYTKDPTAKINSRTDSFQIISKLAYVFIFVFFSQTEYSLFKSIILCIFSSVTFLSYVSNKPYFNQTTQIIAEIFSGVFAWTNYVLLFSQLVESTQFNGAIEIYFLGIPIICILIYTRQEDRLQLLLTSEGQFQKGESCQKKNFFYLHIIETKEIQRYSAIVLKGYINHHSEVCPNDNCPIKQFLKMLARDKQNNENDRKKKVVGGKMQAQQLENNSLLLAQAKALYNLGIKKFPKYTALRIDYANFLQSKMKDRKGALNELSQAEKIKPGLDHQFMIFRQRRIIEDELAEGQEHGGVDFITALNFENQFKHFKQLIEKSSMLHYEFWNHLQDESPDLVRLSQQGAKINTSILLVEDNWKKLSKMSTNTPKALKLYASYLIEILNDKETGNEQMVKAKEAANLRVNFEFNNVNEDFSDLNNYAQDGTPCIYISGEQERIGIVNQCNMSLCKIFGYTKKEDVINKDVEMLMPKTYSDNHKDFLNVSGQKSADQISSRERQVFGKHFSGYIFPLWLQIKNLPSLLSGRQYVATFKVEKTGINKNVCHMLLNKNKEVQDITPSCLKMLGISYEKINKKIIYYDMPTVMPQLFQANQQQYQNKAGAMINFYSPKVVEMSEFKKKPSDDYDIDDIKMQKTHTSNDVQNNDQEDISQIDRGSQDDQDEDQISQLHHKSSKNLRGVRRQESNDPNNDDNDPNYIQYQYKAIGMEDKICQFQCNLTEIYFELVNISYGYHLRLESMPEKSQFDQVQKRIIQNAFQFSYDPLYKRFVRELRDTENKEYILDRNFLELKHFKEKSKLEIQDDPTILKYQTMSYINFLNKKQRQQDKINRGLSGGDEDDDDENQSEDESNVSEDYKKDKTHTKDFDKTTANGLNKDGKNQSATLANSSIPIINPNVNIDYSKMLVAGEGFGRDFIKSEIERLIRVLQTKQSISLGVHTFIRNDGPRKGWEESNNQHASLFSDRTAEIQKIDEEEEEHEKKEKNSDRDTDQLKANIKSKKAFSLAINDKTMPSSIKRLSTSAQIILLFLIAISIAEYAIIFKQFQDTKANFLLIEKSYMRTAELQKVVYNARSMILMNQGILTNYAGYESKDAYVAAIKADFSASLDLIYKIQNDINLSQLPVSDEHDQLLNNKTISSTIFTISNMKVVDFNETNEDVFFLMYNSFNQFFMGLEKSSQLYVRELDDRSTDKKEVTLVFFVLSIVAEAICLIILFPVVHSVNQQKDKVLSLFCEIDNSVIRVLALRCERFINNLQTEEGNDDIDSNEDIENNLANDEDDEYTLLSGTGKRMKKAKGRTKTDKNFFFKFFMALLCIQAYYLQNYFLQNDAVDTTQILNSELNVTASIEPFFWFALNTQREMFFNKTKPIVRQQSIIISKQSIYQLYDQNNQLQEMHLDHQSTLDPDYWSTFESVMRDNLCNKQTYFKDAATCANFSSGMLQQGLHVVMVRYFAGLRTELNNYQINIQKNDTSSIRATFNNPQFVELCLNEIPGVKVE